MALSTNTRVHQRVRPAAVPLPASRPLTEASLYQVAPMRGYYLVTYLGNPRTNHIVLKDRACQAHGPDCPAVEAVATYLKAGGQRAEDVPAHQLIPQICPVCGGAVKFEPRLCSPARGAGWVCVAAAQNSVAEIPGAKHYWQHAWESVRPFMQRGGGQ